MGDCDSIERDVSRLLKQVEGLTDQAKKSTNPSARRLTEMALNRARNQLVARRHDLEVCMSSQPTLSDPRVFGFEVHQGLPGYRLIAGKDTLFRVFLGVRPDVLAPPAVANSIGPIVTNYPLFGAAKLDYASLTIRGPNGTFDVPGDIGDGEFTNYVQSYDEHHNANFYVSGTDIASPGLYHATARFYREGSLVGMVDLKRHRPQPTKDLRLLIVVDTWPMPAAAWRTLHQSLEHVHRAFPIRSGIGPINGNLNHGLRYHIDPEPFDPDWPNWGPVRRYLEQFNQRQESEGQPDRAEHIMTVRVQQPGESTLGGTAEAGPGGSVSGVSLNVNPPSDGVFATLISQEIGHNFLGSDHTPTADISNASAFDLLGRRSIPKPRSIMFGQYSDTPNEDGLFLHADWTKIQGGLLASPSTGNS